VVSNPPSAWIAVAVAIGLLVFVGGPLVAVLQERPTTPEELVAFGGVVAFVGVYLWAIPPDLAGRAVGRPAPATVVLALLGVTIGLAHREADWTVLFIAAGTAAGRVTPPRVAIVAIGSSAALGALVRFAVGIEVGGGLESAFEVTLTGLMVLGFSQLERTARDLQQAEAEVARLAAADERVRIARDVHDLLGHSLSVIALKAELAGRLLERDSHRAGAEMRDVEGVARASLRDIREAVAGYRRMTLDTELAGARVALSAAGIDVDVHAPTGALDTPTDELLGWIVREGVTNVVRHSGAEHCAIHIANDEREVRLEIVDDGGSGDRSRGSAPLGRAGSGLSGIRDRLDVVGGRMESGPIRDRGYRLAAFLPIPTGAGPSARAAGEPDRQAVRNATVGLDGNTGRAPGVDVAAVGGPS
jgi:two-component system sensor histidine kinase DesK